MTDPQDSQSRLRIVQVLNDSSGLTLQWTSIPGVSYQIEATNDLSAGWVNVATLTAEVMLSEIPNIDPTTGLDYRVRVITAVSN